VSGGKPIEDRPGGAKLLSHAREHRPVVIVAKLDRLFRSVADASVTINEFDKLGIELVSITEGFDTTSIYGRAMVQMAAVFAELERGMIRERTKAALNVKRSRGERISRHAPYGWRFTESGQLTEHLREQCVMNTVNELFPRYGFTDIAQRLNSLCEPTRTGAPWTGGAVRNILKRAV
jgi:site-specific DNA recombinase